VKDTAEGATGGIRSQVVGAFTQAAKDIILPQIQQMGTQAAEQATDYAKREAPRLLKEQALPLIMKQVGADSPQDITKKGVGFIGDQIKDSGGLGGFAGKIMSKIGGGGGKGKGGGNATGYGVKRRMPVQQDMFVSVSVEDAYKGWTEYSRWTEFMFRANTVDYNAENEEGGEARVKVLVKMWGFKRPFTAIVDSQVPNEHIRWKATEGTKHVGVIAFHELGDRLTLISVNIDHGPAGPIEKIARGARFDKRQIRSDLHRFKGWIEMKTAEDVEDIEGWMGTIENGKIVQTHDEYMDEQEEESQDGQEDGEGEAGAGQEDEDAEGARQGGRRRRQRREEDPQSGQEGDEEDEEEGGELDEDDDTEVDAEEEDDTETDTEDDDFEEEDTEEPEAEADDEEPEDDADSDVNSDGSGDRPTTSLKELPKRKAAKKRAKKPARRRASAK
jgi:uncharacterized membrane protein